MTVRGGLILLALLLWTAGTGIAQTTTSTSSSSGTTWHYDPVTGHGENLTVSEVQRASAVLRWTWHLACSGQVLVLVYEDPQGDYANATRNETRIDAVDGPMWFEARGLRPGTPYEAIVVPAEQCGLGGGGSNIVAFQTPADRHADGPALGLAALASVLAALGLAARRRLA